jgi:hypothetical protein
MAEPRGRGGPRTRPSSQNHSKGRGLPGDSHRRTKQADRRMKDEVDYGASQDRIAKREPSGRKRRKRNARRTKLNQVVHGGPQWRTTRPAVADRHHSVTTWVLSTRGDRSRSRSSGRKPSAGLLAESPAPDRLP